MMIPTKRFDYTYRPKSKAVTHDKRVNPDSVRGQFLKKMLNMKKVFNSQQKATFAAIKPNLTPDKS